MREPRALDAGTIVGALADDDRRAVFAALVLGAGTLDEVVAATGLDAGPAAKALGRLVDIGLVVAAHDTLVVVGAAFQHAAREALAKPRSSEHENLAPDARKVMDAFVVDGRLQQIPTARNKRLVILDWLAQLFEPGRRYSEAQVNLLLGQRHADTAALRRYLVDDDFLAREGGVYWRSGGTT